MACVWHFRLHAGLFLWDPRLALLPAVMSLPPASTALRDVSGGRIQGGGRWQAVVSLLFPHACAVCSSREALPAEGLVCLDCQSRPGNLVPIGDAACRRCGRPYPGAFSEAFACANCAELELDFRQARAAVRATPFILDLVHRYKYRRELWFEPLLAGLLSRAAVPEMAAGAWDGLVPVPLHPLREREREFNQARRLAGRLSRATGIPVKEGFLRRARPTCTQTLLDRAERAKNVADAFVVRSGVKLDGGRYVIVDDVLTTGATTSAVSRALRRAGAADVVVWTVARGI